jgi:hypothetical protein
VFLPTRATTKIQRPITPPSPADERRLLLGDEGGGARAVILGTAHRGL